MDYDNEFESKRQWLVLKNTHSAEKKEFYVQQSVKYENMKGPITIDFLEKCTTVNNVSYGQLQKQYLRYLLNDSRIYIYIYQNESFRKLIWIW